MLNAIAYVSIPTLEAVVASHRVYSLVFDTPGQAVIWLTTTVAAILLLWRSRGWPALLILTGCIGYLIIMSLNALYMYTMIRPIESIPTDGCVWRHWSLCLLEAISPFAVLCLPVGVLWLALRVARRI
jgi:hypothetical protein